MGDRVAVIKDGHLQQVDTPESLYNHPKNVFVAAFIGSPSMNLFEGVATETDDGGVAVQLGDQRLALPPGKVCKNSGLRGRFGETILVGIRPEDMEDSAVITGHPTDQTIDVQVDVREALGSETLIHLRLKAKSVDSGDPDAVHELGRETMSRCTARLSPESRARPGDRIVLNVTTENMHFFDASSHLVIDT